jgi:pSer/pThr/pTyr-binding forkhead associated (FHA) protein
MVSAAAMTPSRSLSPIGPASLPYGSPPQAGGGLQRPSTSPAPVGGGAAIRNSPVAPAATPQRGRLVVIAKSGADGPSYPFGDLLDIGRIEGNVVVAEDPYLSPRHVRIAWQNGRLVLRDLASTNGVYLRLAASRDVSNRRSSDAAEITVPLTDQDLILVGQQVLRFDVLKEGDGGFGPAQEHGTLLFGSPAAPRYARLCQRTVEGIARDVYYIRKVETVLGRESGDVVFTEDPFLSRRHAAIRMVSRDGAPVIPTGPGRTSSEGQFVLVDLGSSNGTFIRLRGEVDLHPGDHFRVGQQLFRVDFDGPRGRE